MLADQMDASTAEKLVVWLDWTSAGHSVVWTVVCLVVCLGKSLVDLMAALWDERKAECWVVLTVDLLAALLVDYSVD